MGDNKNTDNTAIRVYVNINKAEHQFVKEHAKSQGIDLSLWMRHACGCKLERDGEDGSIFFANSVSDGE